MTASLPIAETQEKRPEQVRPFSCGTDTYDWRERNCVRCQSCGTPDENGEGPCEMETAVSMGFLLGTISTEIAERIGATIKEQVRDGNGYAKMPVRCAAFVPPATCEFLVDAKRAGRRKRAMRRVHCGQPMAETVDLDDGRRMSVCTAHADFLRDEDAREAAHA